MNEELAEPSELDCAQALLRMQEFLDHELDTASADLVRQHLHACEPCLESFDADEAFRKLVRRCCAADQVSAPASLRLRIVQKTTVRFRRE